MDFVFLEMLLVGCIAFVLVRGKTSPRSAGLRGQIQARGWGLVLLPAAVMAAAMAGGANALVAVEPAIAVVLMIWPPGWPPRSPRTPCSAWPSRGSSWPRTTTTASVTRSSTGWCSRAPGGAPTWCCRRPRSSSSSACGCSSWCGHRAPGGMSLQAAERLFASNPGAALALVAEAKESSSRALTELRDLVRGIYPPVLADRGLGDAIRALALDAPLPTVLDIDLPEQVELPVASAVYFSVAEALANATKHAEARSVRIQVSHAAGMLRAVITDDGAGGADPALGTGLAGVERRLATFDGILAVSSPPGGPTIVVIEVPCALSSAKTSSC
jgi:hypothetical protein